GGGRLCAAGARGAAAHRHIVVLPILLGRGVRLWDGLEGLEQNYRIEAVSSPSGVTHVTFTRAAVDEVQTPGPAGLTNTFPPCWTDSPAPAVRPAWRQTSDGANRGCPRGRVLAVAHPRG